LETPQNKKDWIVFAIKNASMIVLLLGALWNYGEIVYDVFSGTNKAQRQEQETQLVLWRKNKECLKQQPDSFETEKKEVIQLLLCPKTTSLLVEVIPPDASLSTAKWIELQKKENSASLFSLYADIRKVKNGTVTIELCRFTTNSFLNIIRKTDSSCFNTVTNLSTGERRMIDVDCSKVCK